MTIKEIIQKLRTTMDDARGQESHFDSWLTQNEGICDAIDALKELDQAIATEESSAVQEPVGVFREDDDIGHVDLVPHQGVMLKDGDLLYTHPQPKREWVGLTNEEIDKCQFDSINGTGWSTDVDLNDYAKAIEAKLKEKNSIIKSYPEKDKT